MLELNKIHLCDCMAGFKQLEDNSIDLIITSPPYNKGNKKKGKGALWNNSIDYDNYEDNMEEEAYQQWQIDLLNECYRVLKPSGSLFYNHKVRPIENGAMPYEWIMKSKMKFRQLIIWDRMGSVNVNRCNFLPTTEHIYWLTKSRNGVRFDRQGNLTEVWRIQADTNSKHPAPYPVEIPDRIIPSILGNKKMRATQGNIIVLDPFMGSGTTAVSAIKHGCDWIGFEMSEKYKAMAEARIEASSKM